MHRIVNPLKPTGYFTYHQFWHSKVLTGDYIALMIRMALRTNSNFCLNRYVFITEVESVYCAVHTESLYNTDKSRP